MSTHCYSLLHLKLLAYVETLLMSVMAKVARWPNRPIPRVLLDIWRHYVVTAAYYPPKAPW